MCGILGFALGKHSRVSAAEIKDSFSQLFLRSESRGKESAGLHVCLPASGIAWTLKGDVPASRLMKTAEYREIWRQLKERAINRGQAHPDQSTIVIAHSRLVTNGAAERPENNQPVSVGSVSMVHNGIIVNVTDLWAEHLNLKRSAEVDTEIMAALLHEECLEGNTPDSATKRIYKEIRGAASIAWVDSAMPCLSLATNTGDLYYHHDKANSLIMFASEAYMLKGIGALGQGLEGDVANLRAGRGLTFDVDKQSCRHFELAGTNESPATEKRPRRQFQHKTWTVESSGSAPQVQASRQADFNLLRYNENTVRSLKRCSRCILPETFPFIHYDAQGVCNYCLGYKPKYLGVNRKEAEKNFLQKIEIYKSKHGEPNVILPFSGGRDSCYGLHLLKKEFGLNPITFTYDWGMVTDLARRNIARMCGQLGVPNILVSADIAKKRMNIRRNVTAWLRRPVLGIVPLFMAGDKQFFKVVNLLKKQTGIRLNIWSSNELENTDFKSGFCGIRPDFQKNRFDWLDWRRKCHLVGYYAWQFARNPAYINASIMDTLESFYSYYIEKREDYFWLFNFIKWEESEVESVITNFYAFERAPDSMSTWRIGDGTAPFYNYIYVTARGFSEFDTFRSNQVREGMLTRDSALKLVVNDNRPRQEGLKWYIETIGLDFNSVILKINKLDSLGLHG